MGAYRIERVDPASWDELLSGFADRTVFHCRAWLEAVSEAYGFRPILAAAGQNGETVAVWPCLEKHKGPFRILGSPLPGTSTPYLGPLFREGADVPAVLRAFAADCTLGRYSFFACRTMDRRLPVDLQAIGFERLNRFETYLLDLRLPEYKLWANLKSECRNRIRKAQKAGVTVQVETGPDFLGDFWQIAVEVFAKANVRPTFSRRFLRLAWANLAARGHICVLTAWFEGHRIGALVLPYDDHTIYYWAGGSYVGCVKLAPNNLLHWEAILEAKRRGLLLYDFISSKGGPGRFKKTFGPEAHLIATHWEHTRNALTRFLKGVYENRMRKLRRLVTRDAVTCGR